MDDIKLEEQSIDINGNLEEVNLGNCHIEDDVCDPAELNDCLSCQ